MMHTPPHKQGAGKPAEGPQVLDQLEPHWNKILAIALLKLGAKEVMIGPADIQAFADSKLQLFTHGKGDDGFNIRLIDADEVARLQRWANENRMPFSKREA